MTLIYDNYDINVKTELNEVFNNELLIIIDGRASEKEKSFKWRYTWFTKDNEPPGLVV